MCQLYPHLLDLLENLTSRTRRQERRERLFHPTPEKSSFLCWLFVPRVFFIPESKHYQELHGAEGFMCLSSRAVQENHRTARWPGKLFLTFPWQALSESSGITDHRSVMERSGSDVSLGNKRSSAKHIKIWKITRLHNTLLYLFFPSWFSFWSEHSPEATLSSVINGKKC